MLSNNKSQLLWPTPKIVLCYSYKWLVGTNTCAVLSDSLSVSDPTIHGNDRLLVACRAASGAFDLIGVGHGAWFPLEILVVVVVDEKTKVCRTGRRAVRHASGTQMDDITRNQRHIGA